MRPLPLLLAAHGTRDPDGVRVVGEIAEGVRAALPGVRVEVAYADVRQPDVRCALDDLGPAVVVPAFLANGYHVQVDIPEQVAGRAVITPPFGPAAELVAAAHERLVEAGWRGEPIALAAAGSSRWRARAEVERAAALLARRTGTEVRVGYATGRPRLADVLDEGMAVASWLLAPGLFHRVALASGASVVAEPLGAHPRVVALAVARYRTAGAVEQLTGASGSGAC